MGRIINPGRTEDVLGKSRRKFLLRAGAGIVTTGLLLSGCDDDDENLAPLLAPGGLTAQQNDAGEIVLNFTDNNVNEGGFVVERSTNMNGPFTEITTLGRDVLTFTDTNLEPGTVYFYRVAAIRNNEKSDFSNVVSSEGGTALVNLGSGDLGVLNYAYALEQLEAAFYTQVLEGNFYAGATDMEKRILEDIQQHEVAHRDFFEAAISSVGNPIPGLMVDFSAVNFDSRDSVLSTAKTFENLGVAAYNGAGKLLQKTDYLIVAGKIVSVEARHAAAIEDLINPNGTFVDFVTDDGLDRAMMPGDVLAAADPFILTRINASNLPTS